MASSSDTTGVGTKDASSDTSRLLSAGERRQVASLVEQMGEGAAARALDVNRETCLRIMAGRPVRRGTAFMVRHRLATLAGDPGGAA